MVTGFFIFHFWSASWAVLYSHAVGILLHCLQLFVLFFFCKLHGKLFHHFFVGSLFIPWHFQWYNLLHVSQHIILIFVCISGQAAHVYFFLNPKMLNIFPHESTVIYSFAASKISDLVLLLNLALCLELLQFDLLLSLSFIVLCTRSCDRKHSKNVVAFYRSNLFLPSVVWRTLCSSNFWSIVLYAWSFIISVSISIFSSKFGFEYFCWCWKEHALHFDTFIARIAWPGHFLLRIRGN